MIWTGQSADSGKARTHDFEGTIRDNHIVGYFKDKEPGWVRNEGNLVVRIEGPNKLAKVAGYEDIKTNPVFGGSEWTR